MSVIFAFCDINQRYKWKSDLLKKNWKYQKHNKRVVTGNCGNYCADISASHSLAVNAFPDYLVISLLVSQQASLYYGYFQLSIFIFVAIQKPLDCGMVYHMVFSNQLIILYGFYDRFI